MSKIGLITIHDTQNYGSLLQTYSLYKAVESLGYQVELIDYKCKAICERETTYSWNECRSPKDVLKTLMWHRSMQKKYDTFWHFMRDNMNLSPVFTKDNISEANYRYDTFLVGSDIVWGAEITGRDRTYFLDFVGDEKRKISFSSSIGTKWNKDDEVIVKSDLERFDAICVREELAQTWLSEIGIKSSVTCDPTMLWGGNYWKEMVDTQEVSRRPYVFVYMWTDDKRTLNHAKKYAALHNLEVHCVQFYNPIKGVINVKPTSIQEWITLIANADSVFTASYHGLLYSLYFHKDVYFYNRGNKSRMQSLSKELKIEDREITDEFSERNSIDYEYVDKVLSKKREKSFLLLKEILTEE